MIKSGDRFGRLTVIERAGASSKGYALWKCKCDCGNEKIVQSRYLREGGTRSCGCYSREVHSALCTKHGKRHTRLYQVHRAMLQRCTNPNAHEYENYGGRGIKVCDEWKDFLTFEKWAIENGYEEKARGKCTLDRIDTNKGYEPSNCRFVDMKHQQRNRRNNVTITYNGETHCLSEWAEILGVPPVTLSWRNRHGWTPKEVLFGRI